MIQYETRLQTTGKSIMVSKAKRMLENGETPMVLSVQDGRLVEVPVTNVVNRGKQQLLFFEYGLQATINCGHDCEILTDRGFQRAALLTINDTVRHTRTVMQRPRLGVRGKMVNVADLTDARLKDSQITNLEESYLMWYGKKTDVLDVEVEGSDNIVTSTGFIVRSMNDRSTRS